MQLLDMVRRKMLHQQHHLLKEAELHRLDDEIRKKLYRHHFPNQISMNNENIALRFKKKDEDAKYDTTELCEAKTEELKMQKQLNDMHQQKIKCIIE
ncbi:unnamed protein product [Rotaria sordida]|uniref:Uncharacterized protein n=1 Tax=Rotaria sordida TaxID=392033 RepID=A0A819RQ16_9BILA|nr:unnamed protein product [Rotaria sordida]